MCGCVCVQSLNCVHVRLFETPWTEAHQASLSFIIFQSCSDWCPLSQRCHPTIPSSVSLFSFCLQSSPACWSFPKAVPKAHKWIVVKLNSATRWQCSLKSWGGRATQASWFIISNKSEFYVYYANCHYQMKEAFVLILRIDTKLLPSPSEDNR